MPGTGIASGASGVLHRTRTQQTSGRAAAAHHPSSSRSSSTHVMSGTDIACGATTSLPGVVGYYKVSPLYSYAYLGTRFSTVGYAPTRSLSYPRTDVGV
eukprot:2398018-Rhodomonas_salina.1